MPDLLYRWPAAAKVCRRIPKEKLYEHGAVDSVLREKFISQVQSVTWSYKLAEVTINLPGSTTVPEIQIFQIDSKTSDVSEAVLAAIDKAVQYPIIFEITRSTGSMDEVRMVSAYKQLGSGAPKIGGYCSTSWQRGEASRQSLPTAITLAGLYIALLHPLTSLTIRPGEELSEVAGRLAVVRKLEREVAALERKLHAEPQLNRKVELRRALKTKQHELEQQR